MTTPLVADSTARQYSAGTLPRLRQLITTCTDTPTAKPKAVGPPAAEMAFSIDIPPYYTRRLVVSNDLCVSNNKRRMDNSRMELIDRIKRALDQKGMGWADLARAMKISEQRLNNWRTRGVPAAQVRNVEAAIGLPRYFLDYDDPAHVDDSAVVAEFAWVYRHASDDGKALLVNTVGAVKRAYCPVDRKSRTTDKR